MLPFVMMALGSYRFAVYTGGYQELKRKNSWRWAEQEVIGARPALQFIGPGCEEISISGVIYTHYRGGLGQVRAMRAQAGLGIPLTMIDGNGEYFGDYVILAIEEGKSGFLPDGTPRKIDFALELKMYA